MQCTETHLRSDNRVAHCGRKFGHDGACRSTDYGVLTVWPSERALEAARDAADERQARAGLAMIGPVQS